MRIASALIGAAALAVSNTAAAAPVTLAPISFSPEFQTDLEEDYGVREGDVLQRAVLQAVERELQSRGATLDGAGALTIEISILDADPNRPTMQQLSDQPGLDAIRSVSIGGAELHAVLRNGDGAVVSEVTHRRYNHSLADLSGAATTWTEARRAIRQFANKVADAYAENAQ
ncbi:MAG: DUF3313 family protein [Phycisphaerales bacterium]|nr:DUF3313 family protein [Hyphomonadaceae bacterium]